MADETQVPEIVVPEFSFRTITMEEYRANYDKRGETPWPIIWHDGRWLFVRDGAGDIAVYKPEWNEGRPFVIPSSLISGGVKINMIADAEGKLLGTEETPKQEAKPDEIQDGGGLRGVPAAAAGNTVRAEEAEEEAPETPGTAAPQ